MPSSHTLRKELDLCFLFFFQDFISIRDLVKYIFECVGPISESIVVYMVLASIKDALQT